MKLELTNGAFRALFTNIHMFASTDAMLPTLAGARLELDGTDLRVTVTDRFGAITRKTDTLASDAFEPVTLDAKSLHDVARKLPKSQAYGAVTITVDGPDARHADIAMGDGSRLTVPVIDGDYPNVMRIFEGAIESAVTEVSPMFALSASNLTKIAKLWQRGDTPPSFALSERQHGPVLFTVGSTVGVVMPLRAEVGTTMDARNNARELI